MGRRSKQTFLQRRHTDGEQAYVEILNITNYQRNANQNYNEVKPPFSQNYYHQEDYEEDFIGGGFQMVRSHSESPRMERRQSGSTSKKRTQALRKVPVWGARQVKKLLSFSAQKAVQVPKRTQIHISFPFSTERKKR